MPGYPQLGLGGDSSSDLGFGVGLNLSRLCNTGLGGSNSMQSSTAGLLAGSGSASNTSDGQSNAEIFQRLSQMLENSADLSSLSNEAATKRNFQDSTQLNMYDLFGGFGSTNVGSGNQIPSQTPEDVLALLQQHHINQALQQQLEQQRQQNQLKYGTSSVLFNKNDGQSALAKLLPSNNNNNPPQRTVRQSSIQTVSSGIGDSPISSGSSPGAHRGSRSQSTSGFCNSMQPGTHSTPTSCCRAIRGTSVFRESNSPSLDHVLMMGGQRNNDVQGSSPADSSDLSMLSSSGISSVESSLNELMQSLNMSGSSATGISSPSVNPFVGQGLQMPSAYQQAASMKQQQNMASLHAALQQSGLAQLGNLTGNDLSSPQSLQTLQTNLQNIQELANLQNLQNLQSLRNLQSLQLSNFLSGSCGLTDRSSPLAAFSAVESALQSSWSQSSLNAAAALGLGGSSPLSYGNSVPADNNNLERSARIYRNAAALCDPTCTWSGHLPPRSYKNATYSCKVFLGGVPWDITEVSLTNAFKQFGSIKVEWPGKDNVANPPKGYVYIIFDNEKHVKALLQACTHDYSNGGSWYYKISSRRMRSKEVQVIPWMLSDSNYVRSPTQRLDPQKTVFVGALHGMLNAEGLAHIMNDLFGGVLYAGIDTDKYKYPIGSGRVTFNNNRSYMKAVSAAFIEIKTPKFTKKVQVDPYLEDSLCANCGVQQGPYFCRDLNCFKYFCRSCWQYQHMAEPVKHHRPLMRHYKGSGGQQQQQQTAQPTNTLTSASIANNNVTSSPSSVQQTQNACESPQSPLENSM